MLEASAGAGAVPGACTQLAISVTPRLVLGSASNRYVPGVGVVLTRDLGSGGHGLPVWLSVEPLAYEHRFATGLSLSVSAGISLGLGGGTYCFDCGGSNDYESWLGKVLPQLRLGLGYWF